MFRICTRIRAENQFSNQVLAIFTNQLSFTTSFEYKTLTHAMEKQKITINHNFASHRRLPVNLIKFLTPCAYYYNYPEYSSYSRMQ